MAKGSINIQIRGDGKSVTLDFRRLSITGCKERSMIIKDYQIKGAMKEV